MKAKVLKGKFTCAVTGSTVRITCDLCEAVPPPSSEVEQEKMERAALRSPVPGATELASAGGLIAGRPKKEQSKWTQASEKINRELGKKAPNAMATMIVAPVALVGRASGYQPIVCFHCRQPGLIEISSERLNTARKGFVQTVVNEDPAIHASNRVRVTFVTLLALHEMVQQGLRSSMPVVCAGASLQCPGRSSTGSDGKPRQDAHQVLRELSINGVPLYDLPETARLSPEVKTVLTYCHGTVSHLDGAYNEADGLVEHQIVVEMLDLAHMILSQTLWQRAGKHSHIFGRLLWSFIVIRYRYAIRMALIHAEDMKIRQILLFYLSIVERMYEEGPEAMAEQSLQAICDEMSKEVRKVGA